MSLTIPSANLSKAASNRGITSTSPDPLTAETERRQPDTESDPALRAFAILFLGRTSSRLVPQLTSESDGGLLETQPDASGAGHNLSVIGAAGLMGAKGSDQSGISSQAAAIRPEVDSQDRPPQSGQTPPKTFIPSEPIMLTGGVTMTDTTSPSIVAPKPFDKFCQGIIDQSISIPSDERVRLQAQVDQLRSPGISPSPKVTLLPSHQQGSPQTPLLNSDLELVSSIDHAPPAADPLDTSYIVDGRAGSSDQAMLGARPISAFHVVTAITSLEQDAVNSNTPATNRSIGPDETASETPQSLSSADNDVTTNIMHVGESIRDIMNQQTILLPASKPAMNVIASQIAETIGTVIVGMHSGDVVSVDADLRPPELGRLRIQLEKSDSGLLAIVTAEDSVLHQTIAHHLSAIEHSVRLELSQNEWLQLDVTDHPSSHPGSSANHEGAGRNGSSNHSRSWESSATLTPRTRTQRAEVDVLA